MILSRIQRYNMILSSKLSHTRELRQQGRNPQEYMAQAVYQGTSLPVMAFPHRPTKRNVVPYEGPHPKKHQMSRVDQDLLKLRQVLYRGTLPTAQWALRHNVQQLYSTENTQTIANINPSMRAHPRHLHKAQVKYNGEIDG